MHARAFQLRSTTVSGIQRGFVCHQFARVLTLMFSTALTSPLYMSISVPAPQHFPPHGPPVSTTRYTTAVLESFRDKSFSN